MSPLQRKMDSFASISSWITHTRLNPCCERTEKRRSHCGEAISSRPNFFQLSELETLTLLLSRRFGNLFGQRFLMRMVTLFDKIKTMFGNFIVLSQPCCSQIYTAIYFPHQLNLVTFSIIFILTRADSVYQKYVILLSPLLAQDRPAKISQLSLSCQRASVIFWRTLHVIQIENGGGLFRITPRI